MLKYSSEINTILDRLYATNTKPAQNRTEFFEMLEIVKVYEPKVILEIGLFQCGAFRAYQEIFEPDILIGIDNSDYAAEQASKLDFDAHILAPAKSQDGATYLKVVDILDDASIKLLVIDGDHHLEAVIQDFEMYTRLLADKAIVVMHDIAVADYDFCQVHLFWESIKRQYQYQEIIRDVGTGIIFWGA